MTVAEPIVFVAATDADLLAAVARGESAALSTLAERYGRFVHAAALRQTADPATADDVTQAVLIVLSQKAGKIAARALPAWLHQTTRYAAANANRAAKRRRFHEQRAAKAEGRMDATPEDISPLLTLLDEAIARLGETDRRAIVGRFLLGHDAATVAATLGVSPRAAQKRIERAVEKLRERLIAAQRSRFQDSAAEFSTMAEPSPRGAATASAPPAPLTALAITPAVVAAVLIAAAPSPASAAVVAVPTVTAATLAQQTATWMTIAKVKAALLAIVPAAFVTGAVATMAVVTPTQTTRPANPRPPAVQVTQSQPPAALANPKPVAARGTLRNGVWIEYLGVSEIRNADQPTDQPWYGIDGRPLAVAPIPASNNGSGTNAGDDRVQRRHAFSFDPTRATFERGTPAATRFELDYNRSAPMSAFSDYLRLPQNDNGDVVARDRFGVYGFVRPKELGKITFRIAAGPWVPRVVSQADADVTVVAQNDVVSTFLSQPFEDTNEATIWYRPAEFYSRPDVRLVAIDTAGQVHELQQRYSWYRSPQERADEPLYDKPLPRMQFNKTPFGEVLKQLEAQGVPIVAKWEDLKVRHNVTPQTPVTGRIGPDPLYIALERLFQWVGDQGEPQFDVKDGVVTVRASDQQNQRPWPFYAPGLPLAKLDRFEVQTRNFDQWISFENLTAELGKSANLMIRTSDDPRADVQVRDWTETGFGGRDVALANGGRVELVAIGDAKTGECWRPDGTPRAIPFGYQPTTDYPAPAGKRLIWALTVTRDSAGKTGLGRTYLLNGQGTGDAAGGFSATAGTAPDGTVYQVRELLIDDKQQTVDWAVGVASMPARKVSIERGPDGWAVDVLGKLVMDTGEAAYVWGPETKTVVPRTQFAPTGRTAWKVWTPISIGPRHGLQMDYVTQTGQSPNGSALGPADAGGFHLAVCHEKLENLHRVTMGITEFDLAAKFRNVSLLPGKQTAVGTAAEKLERLPGR